MSKPEQINALAVTGLATAAITLAPGAEAHRASLLTLSKAITEVDEFTLDAASDALKLLQETARAVEKQRVKEKAPALDFGRQIDDCAKGYTAPINAEADRLSRLIGGYMAEQQRIAREAEEARQRAVREQQRQAEEAAREAAKLAIEESAKRAGMAVADPDEDFPTMPDPTPAPVAPPAFLAPLPPPAPEPVKVQGIQVRPSWEYEVTDLAALFAARPELCTIEPNPSAIRAALAADKPIPGLRYWQVAKATSTKSKS
jgi:hypothetical protein